MEGLINLEVHEELIDVKFFSPIEPRMIDVSRTVYKRMLSEFQLEKNLLEYMFCVFTPGSSKANQFFNSQKKQKLSNILKTYALAEMQKIPRIFEKETYESIIKPMRGTPKNHEEITAVFYHLLKENQNGFLENEVRMCRGEGGPIAAEYVVQSLVRTMCGQPPRKVSLFDLSIRNCNIEFQKMDFFILLKLADKVLGHFLKNG